VGVLFLTGQFEVPTFPLCQAALFDFVQGHLWEVIQEEVQKEKERAHLSQGVEEEHKVQLVDQGLLVHLEVGELGEQEEGLEHLLDFEERIEVKSSLGEVQLFEVHLFRGEKEHYHLVQEEEELVKEVQQHHVMEGKVPPRLGLED